MDAKIRHKFIQHNFVDCFNSIIEYNQFAIIKYGSYKFSIDTNKHRRNILANMLRSSGYGFIAAEKITNNISHSDHDEISNAFLVPDIDESTAEYITNRIGINDFLRYDPRFPAQILHVNLLSNVKEVLPKDLCAQKITDAEIKNIKENALYSIPDSSEKWVYNYSRANKKLLCNLIDSYSYKFAEPNQNYANEVYHEIIDENNTCLFIFNKIIKFMPTDVLVKNDEFRDSNIVSRLDVYLPLLEK